jgi:ABC-type transport system involved in multi-copper enzyme maturation permease subunit
MMHLYKAWRESRLGFVLSIAALATIGTLFCLFPRLDPQHKYTYTQTMYLVTYAGVLRNIFIVLTLLLGLGGFLRERSHCTLQFTLALPARRSHFFAARALVGVAELSAFALVPAILVPMFSRWSHHSYPSIPQALHFSVLWICCGAMFFAFGLFLSTFVPGDYPAATACLISLFVYLVILEFAPLEKFPSFDLFNVIAAWHMPYFSGRDTCFVTYLPWGTLSIVVLLALGIITLAAQIAERQDF